MALPRSLRRLLLSFLWPRPTHAPPDEYATNYRAYYAPSKKRPRRARRQLRLPSVWARLPLLMLYLVLTLCVVAKLSGKQISLAFRRETEGRSVGTTRIPPQSRGETRVVAVQADHVVEGMRPPQFGEEDAGEGGGARGQETAGTLHALDDSLASGDDDMDEASFSNSRSSSPSRASAQKSYSLSPAAQILQARDHVQNLSKERHAVEEREIGTRTCYHSSKTSDAVCVHVPFCVRHNSIVYMSDTLKCAPYSNKQGTLGTLSMGRCVELERELETEAQIEQVEHKPKSWLDSVNSDGNILWFEGDSVFVRMGVKCKSVMHFVNRIFMLHHVLQHPERYGMGGVSNVVVAADESVAKKIRYTKSWHHGLLKAIVHPNKLHFGHKGMPEMVTSVPSTPGEIRVFVPSGLWDLAKGKHVPCFRRAAIPGSLKTQFFLSEDVFPGVVETGAETSPTKYRDADVFRTLLFQSLGHSSPPKMKKEILYLHRTSTRTFTRAGQDILESTLTELAKQGGFEYRLLDVAGMTFPEQIAAVAGAGVVVGVHGTQMLNTLFLPAGAAIVEIFPSGLSNNMFVGGSGAGLHYARYQLLKGDPFPQLSEFQGLGHCLKVSRECRTWYQSDNRKLSFGILDAAAAGSIVQEAISHVAKSL